MSGLRNKMNKYNVNVLTVIPGFITSNKDNKENYPRVLVTTPKKLALKIFNAQQSNKDVIYSSTLWQLICLLLNLFLKLYSKNLKYNMKIAFFDFDGTITKADSTARFIRYLVGDSKFFIGIFFLYPLYFFIFSI